MIDLDKVLCLLSLCCKNPYSNRVFKSIRKLWLKAYLENPIKTTTQTLLLFSHKGVKDKITLLDPELLIKLCEPLLKSNELLQIAIQIFKCGQKTFEITIPKQDFKSFTLIHHSLLIQSLFKLLNGLDTLKQITICKYIHQLFIDDMDLIRLVNHQRYDINIIHVLVKHIPSMHVTIDYIMPVKDLFSMELALCLFQEYPLEKTEKMAVEIIVQVRKDVGVLDNIEDTKETKEFVLKLKEWLKRLALFYNVFNSLLDSIVVFLSGI
jgi:hypothetical protein